MDVFLDFSDSESESIESTMTVEQSYNALVVKFDSLYAQFGYSFIEQIKKRLYKEYNDKADRKINYFGFFEVFIKIIETEYNICYYADENLIITNNGLRCIKIIGRNPRYIDIDHFECGKHIKFKQSKRCVLGKEFIVAFFELPDEEICEEIEALGYTVKTIDDFPLAKFSFAMKTSSVAYLNPATLITLCSEISYDAKTLDNHLLAKYSKKSIEEVFELAVDTRKYIEDKLATFDKIIVSKSGWNVFTEIMKNIGGVKENERAIELEKKVIIISEFEEIKDLNIKNTIICKHYNATMFTAKKTYSSQFDYSKIPTLCKIHTSFSLCEKEHASNKM